MGARSIAKVFKEQMGTSRCNLRRKLARIQMNAKQRRKYRKEMRKMIEHLHSVLKPLA